MPSATISVKWSGKKFDGIQVDFAEPATALKQKLFQLTSVEPAKQKIMVKGGILKDDSNLSQVISDGSTYMMMGTPGSQIPQVPTEQPKFIEDMSESEINAAGNVPAGLVNLGNTCYMNATLQCLKSIPELSDALKRQNSTFGTDGEKNLTISMRDLFGLLDKNGSAVTPLVFLQTMRAQFPQFSQRDRAQYFMQQDAEECFTALVSTLDRSLVDSSSDSSFVSKYMTGLMEQTMTCNDAPTEEPTKTIEKIYRLNCHISQSVSYLSQGLQEAMKENIEKNSPSLNRTASYTRTSKLVRCPKYLTVGFVRFFWKMETGQKTKIIRAVKYPFDLDVFEFCSPALQESMKPARELLDQQIQEKLETRKRLKLEGEASFSDPVSVSSASNTGGKTAKEILKEKGMDSSLLQDEGANIHGHYELTAVLTHVGRSADAGHYMAWTRDETSPPDAKLGHKWWKFDDDKVSPVTQEDVGKLSGGGDWHMAYMLLYKAKEFDA